MTKAARQLRVLRIHEVEAAAEGLQIVQHALAERAGARGRPDDGDARGVEDAREVGVAHERVGIGLVTACVF